MSTGTTAQSLVTQLAELMKKSESELERLSSEISKKDKQISDLEGKLETAKAERADLAAQADLLKSAIPASVLPDAAGETQQAAPAVAKENASEAPASVETAVGTETEEQAASGDDAGRTLVPLPLMDRSRRTAQKQLPPQRLRLRPVGRLAASLRRQRPR